MARPLRIVFPGAIYHVNCRMIGDAHPARAGQEPEWPPEQSLFRDDADRERFLEQLEDRVLQYGIRLYLFVLMTNHFHLVFETPEANCPRFMQSLTTAYPVYYNLRHRRHGHLLDGRYKAKLVEGDDYLLALTRYVHLNPVHVKGVEDKDLGERVQHLRGYRWSSYPSYIGRRKPLGFVEYGPLLAQMHGQKRDWPRNYREYVEEGLVEPDGDFEAAYRQSPRSIGGDTFRDWIDALHQEQLEKRLRPEDVSFRRITEPRPAGLVLEVLAEVMGVDVKDFRKRRRSLPLRAVAARFLTHHANLTQREVADLLDIGTGAAVSRQLAGYAVAVKADRKLRRLVQEAEKRIMSAPVSGLDGA